MTIAIVSTNQNKYSETFIHNHIKLLPANVHFLFDGYLPRQYSTDKGLTAHSFETKQKRRPWFGRQRSEEEQLNLAIENYLTGNRVDLVFCEYGPSGVAMLPACRKTKIPLVVHFHGYDAYRSDVLSTYGKAYPALFAQARAVIGVSKNMCAQLQKLGCDPAKLHCLPYGIDTGIFYVKDNKKDITFVACGRFVAKKAPQLSLRAFAEVHRHLPQATLVMIGDGELLAECIQLAEALGIKAAVDFKGALSQQETAAIYSRSLVFVQHSITTTDNDSEGTPLAIMESAASGLPAVSTRHGGIGDVVADGETGYLVNEGDVSAMAVKMLLLAQRPELAMRMGARAAALAAEKYDIKDYTQKLWQIMQKSL